MDGDMTPRDLNLLTGRMAQEEIPSVKAHVVRVYICSNGTDSITERDAFTEFVYPRLREYCRDRYSLEFQVVDLAWGLSPEAMNANQSDMTPLRIREIQKCHALSAGPSFLAFIGQKYGPRSLPDVILADDFDVIRVALETHKARDTRNAGILDDCYVIDSNNVPAVYILKDKERLVPEYNDPEEVTRQSAPSKWTELQTQLRRLLQRGAEFAYLDGTMDSESRERYFVSELENQILLGLEGCDSPQRRCVLVTRDIDDLRNYAEDPRSEQFVEILYDDREERHLLDAVSADMTQALRNRVRGLVTSQNCIHHSVLWRYSDVISRQFHGQYLNRLCDQLYDVCVRLIDQTAPLPRAELPSVCEESFQHWSRCKYLAVQCYGQLSPLNCMKAYVGGSTMTPLVMYGPHGCGKTKLVSRLAYELNDLNLGEYIVALRYIGLTPKSHDLRQLLLSLCLQITMATGGSPDTIPSDIKDLLKAFKNVLNSVPPYLRLIIILDGIETISPDHNAHALEWLPTDLLPNVKIILTTHPSDGGIMERLKNELLPSNESFLEVKTTTVDECEDMLVRLLAAMDRSINQPQMAVFRKALEQEPIPLYVELLANIAKDINSFIDPLTLNLPASCEEGVEAMLDRLEQRHGKVLVSKAFGYMITSESGLSDCEMEDVLSLDEEVLLEVYDSYHPSLRRVPFVKWLKLKQDVESFLTYRDADGVTVAVWQHDSFVDAIRKRYLCDEAAVVQLHSILADYFLGTWAGRVKPVALGQGRRLAVAGFNADRKVPYQPLVFGDIYGESVRFNKRKYDQVPRHLQLSGRLQELNSLVLFNYEWLYNKLNALSLQHIMADFTLNPSEEASLVEEALRVSESTIEKDLNNLACEISGHLLPYYSTHANIRSLISQCDTHGLQHCALVPNFPYLHVPGSSLQFTLDMPVDSEYFRFLHEERFLVCKKRDDAYVYQFDLLTGETKKAIFTSNGELYTTPDGRYFIVVDHVTEKAIKIHESTTGAFIKQIIFMNHIEGKSNLYKKGQLSLTNDRLCAIVTLSYSVLCICDIPSGNVLHIITLDGKADVCTITPDGRRVFCNSNAFLLAYDLYTLEQLLTIPIGCRPSCLVFTHDSLRAFVSNDRDNRVTIMHLSDTGIDMTYRAVFDDKLMGDPILGLTVSPDDALLLVRSRHTILVHHRSLEKVIAVFTKPKDVPEEFRLPKAHYFKMTFTDAQFSYDSNFVIGTIFRNVYMWHVSSGSLVTSIQAPIGLITSLLVSEKRSQIVTHMMDNKTIQVWNIDEAVRKVNAPDKLTDAVCEFQLTLDNQIALAKCRKSDELGVIDMSNSTMLDLMTHDSPIRDFAVTPDGAWVLVSTKPQRKNTAFKLWNMEERRIVMETGNSSGYCVGMKEDEKIIIVSQKDTSFRAPFYMSVLYFSASEFNEHTYSQQVDIIRSKPFVTDNDQYLIINSAAEFDESRGEYSQPCIKTFKVNEGMKMVTYDASDLKFEEHLQDILQIRSCAHSSGTTIAAIFSCKNNSETDDDTARDSGYGTPIQNYGFFLLDVSAGTFTQLCIPFPTPDPMTNQHHLVFSKDCSKCLDEFSNVFHLESGMYVGQIPGPDAPPKAFVLGDTAVVYSKGPILYVVREDGTRIARCNVHAPICLVHVCSDDRTLVIGCTDGTIQSYTIVDPCNDNVYSILSSLKSRAAANNKPEPTERRLSRSWDKLQVHGVPKFQRPPSAIHAASRDRMLLKQIKAIPRERPKSDTIMHVRSQACLIM